MGLASTEAESFCLHGLWQIAMSSDTAACENLESALAAYAFHDLKTMASTSAVIALARVALAAVRVTSEIWQRPSHSSRPSIPKSGSYCRGTARCPGRSWRWRASGAAT